MTGESSTNRLLLVKAKGGFGNRILSAVTGITLANVTNRTAVIDWRDGDYMPRGVNAYPLLFEDPVGIDVARFDDRTDVVPQIWQGRLGEYPVDIIEQFFPRDHGNPRIYRKLSVDLAQPDVEEPLAVFWSYLPKSARIRKHVAHNPRFKSMRPAAVTKVVLDQYFRPNQRVRDEVSLLLSGRRHPIIGVHIRYTDRKVSMKRIMSEVTRLRKRMPDAPIFLATDNERVQAMFRAKVDNVFVIEKRLGDDSNSLHERAPAENALREAENALIDMWALAGCDWIIHSRHSTFSVTAALIGGIPRNRQRDIDRWNPRVVAKRWIQAWT